MRSRWPAVAALVAASAWLGGNVLVALAAAHIFGRAHPGGGLDRAQAGIAVEAVLRAWLPIATYLLMPMLPWGWPGGRGLRSAQSLLFPALLLCHVGAKDAAERTATLAEQRRAGDATPELAARFDHDHAASTRWFEAESLILLGIVAATAVCSARRYLPAGG